MQGKAILAATDQTGASTGEIIVTALPEMEAVLRDQPQSDRDARSVILEETLNIPGDAAARNNRGQPVPKLTLLRTCSFDAYRTFGFSANARF